MCIRDSYRPGGNQAPLPPFCSSDEAAQETFSRRFNSDEAETTEFGIKSRGENYSANVTYFEVDWDGIIIQVTPGCGWRYNFNGGKAETSGVEVDFTYANNDHMTNMYFWHPAYDDYPVVGVTWQQCNAFNVWRTQLLNSWRSSNYESYVQDFRLPSETEWEYASRGGLDNNPYPWGGPYIRNSRGCFLGNFKPMRGRYMEDGGFKTVKASSYHPNDFGLYLSLIHI